MWRLLQSVVVILAIACVCAAQAQRMETPRLVPLRLIITVDGDVEKAGYVTVELMDSVGSSSATDSKLTDNNGRVSFQAPTGVHRIRITGPDIRPYEGELEIARNEVSHVERIRVRRAETDRRTSETSPGGLVAALRLRVPGSARKAFEQAGEAMRQQHWQESRTLFETAIREYPQYDLAYNGLGMAEVELNEIEAARQSFSKAIELNPNFAAAYRNLARISLTQRNYAEADKLLVKSLEDDPLNAWALTSAANAELILRKYNDAITHARKAHSVPHQDLGGVHIVAALALEAIQQPLDALKEYQLYLDEEPSGRDVARAKAAVARLGAAATPPK